MFTRQQLAASKRIFRFWSPQPQVKQRIQASPYVYEAAWQQVVRRSRDLVTQGMERPNPRQRFQGGQDNREESRDLSASIHADEILAKSQEVECG